MSHDLPSFPAIRAFEAAARHLSFKHAAQELHVTHSAVSHQIKSLEEFLGVALFRRGTRGVALTSEGGAYLEGVSRVLDELSCATRSVRSREPAGPLYVRATPAFASRWLVPRLNDFNHHHPGIELHVSTSLESASFADDGVDVNIRFGSTFSGEFHAEPFLKSTRFPVASPALLRRQPRLREPGDLRRLVLLHNEVEDGWPEWFESAGVHGVEPDPGPRFEHCNLTLRAASEGQGVALAYGALVTEELAAGTLVRLFDVNLPSTVIYSLVCPKAYLSQPRVAAFREWLVAAAALDSVQADAQSVLTAVKVAG